MKGQKRTQNRISLLFLKGSDLRQREHQVLKDASERTGFIPKKLLRRSSWWTSKEIGAFQYEGEFKGKKALLKIQGIKPQTSEIYMIKSFSETNKSKILRPPHLYATLPWDDGKRYEALIMELVESNPVVNLPAKDQEIDKFYDLYLEYRNNCLNSPWLDKPEESISESVEKNFSKWRVASFKLYPSHRLRKEEDKDLIDEAVKILGDGYKGIEPEFQHPHLTELDLYRTGNQVVILSNLYWAWRAPIYDAIFGFHWFKYRLSNVRDITQEQIDKQIGLWLSKIESLSIVRDNERLYKLAMLERYAAGLNLDSLSINSDKSSASYLVESTRRELRKLIVELSK